MNAALHGKTIVNTRAIHQAEALNTLLRAQGAIVLNYPTIMIVPPPDCTLLDAALVKLVAGDFDWLVLTSTNAVWAIAERCSILGISLGDATFRTATIGRATSDSAHEQLGLQPITLAQVYDAESLGTYLPLQHGERILVPESAIARPTLANRLLERGATIALVDAYQTICAEADETHMLQQPIDAITFTSSSTVTCFFDRMRKEGGDPQAFLTTHVVCIGAQTASTAREHGFTQVIVSVEPTLNSFVDALARHFAQQPSQDRNNPHG